MQESLLSLHHVDSWFELGAARFHLCGILPSLPFHLYVDSGASNSGCQSVEQAPSPESNLVSPQGRKDRSLMSSY